MRVSRSTWKRHLLVIGLYSLLALVLTYPLALHFTTHVPGDGGDDPALAWNLWWVKYTLLDLGTNPFHCDYMFHPIGINLAFYTLTVLNALISIPLQGTFGLIPASNIVLLSSFVLGGYGTFLLVRHLLAEKNTPYAPLVVKTPLSGFKKSQINPRSACTDPTSSAIGIPRTGNFDHQQWRYAFDA